MKNPAGKTVVDGLLTTNEEFLVYPDASVLEGELILFASEYPNGP